MMECCARKRWSLVWWVRVCGYWPFASLVDHLVGEDLLRSFPTVMVVGLGEVSPLVTVARDRVYT